MKCSAFGEFKEQCAAAIARLARQLTHLAVL